MTDEQFGELRARLAAAASPPEAAAAVRFFEDTEDDEPNVLPPVNADTNRLSDFVRAFVRELGGDEDAEQPWHLMPARAFRYVRFPVGGVFGLLLYFGGDLDRGVIACRGRRVHRTFRMADAVR